MHKGNAQLNLICWQCKRTETPLWRTGPAGPKTLCNACGVRWKKGKLILNERAQGLEPMNEPSTPAASPTATRAKQVSAPNRKRPARHLRSDTGSKKRGRTTSSPSAAAVSISKEKASTESGEENSSSGAGAWSSPAASPVSKPSSPVSNDAADEMNGEVELLSMNLSASLEQFDAEPAAEKSGTDVLDEIEDLRNRATSMPDSKRFASIPISPATSSVCPESPPSSFLTSPLLTMNASSSLKNVRAAVYDPQSAILKPYKECVVRLGELCVALPNEDPKDYVRAFAHDQSNTLNPCGLSPAESQMHDLVLRGFFRNESAYSNALWSFREAFASPELLEFGSNAFVELLVEDVTRFIPALQQKDGHKVSVE
mmetsp:Transcript_4359/g.13184  ORF Transcript_4359/g.13184 Transcript_4359/m.13184 type:complete len:371 (+) Transcript_4359:261-1373(+)|eukprot:CAMPEP_0198722624 /NCGR_PEP_ID=MMETSP1475-20131203/279_1 /TAXON_ID= ORGANISM="Unidentified sp., Strain CCMP1999" /NCGR_SAMPLE_ID=MMETSP1475 /ASSEMBLY_ACC=CAM_ASM_001111 /LENGTH=370 /DNA_ID=CAMNT_0044483535 /DNA_START=256 /DNA_END=1368 /DNA_ORIENTATION=-